METKTTKERESGIFTVEFPLITEPWQEDQLAKKMELARRVYNQTLQITLSRYEEAMEKDPAVSIRKELKEINKEKYTSLNENMKKGDISKEEFEEKKAQIRKKRSPREKELYRDLNQIYFDIGISRFGVPRLAQEVAKNAGYTKLCGKKGKRYRNLDSTTAACIGNKVYAAWQRRLFGSGEKLHFHKYGTVNSLSGKRNDTGIMVKMNHSSKHWSGEETALVYNGLEIPIKVQDSYYETECFEHEIAFNRIVRRKIGNKERYFVQIVFRGTAPMKVNEETGEVLHPMGKGIVAIAIDSEKLAVVSPNGSEVISLNKDHMNHSEQIAEIQRKIDASRRATNPENFNEDGTVKSGIKLTWKKSKRYRHLQNKVTNLRRKEAVNRKISHYKLANYLLSLGDTFYVSKVSFKEKQMRTKDSFVRIPRKQLTKVSSSDTIPSNVIEFSLRDDSTLEKHPNILLPEKLFLLAKAKEVALHIIAGEQEFIVSEEAVKALNGPYTHRNEGTKIMDNAPATLITLLKQKVETSNGSFHKESVRSLAIKAKQSIPEQSEDNSDAGEKLICEAMRIYDLAQKLNMLDVNQD